MSFSTLSIGRSGLLISQYALNTTGNNVANAATPGYARQFVNQQALVPQEIGGGVVGLGVGVESILRVADNFLEQQLRNAYSHDTNLSQMETAYTNLQVYFNEPSDCDLSTAMDEFWAAVSNLNDAVEDTASRRQLTQKAESLAERVNTLSRQIREYRAAINGEIQATVNHINTITGQIAQLNKAIVNMEYGGLLSVSANDLRDQRDVLIKELAGIVDIQTSEEANGSVIVRQGNRTLVYYDSATRLKTEIANSDDMLVYVPAWPDGTSLAVSDGALAAQLAIRDEVLRSYKRDLDFLAAQIAWQVNRALSQGVGLVGYTEVKAANAPSNPAAYLDELDFGFAPQGDAFKVQNGSFEIIVRDLATGAETAVVIEIDLDRRLDPLGDRDIVLYDRDQPDAENSLVSRVQRALDAVVPGGFSVGVDNRNNFYIRCLSDGCDFGFGRDSSGLLAALGINTLFTGHDGESLGVSAVMSASPQFIPGARKSETQNGFVAGNNDGIKALLALRSSPILDGGSSTLEGFYQGITGRLGVEGQRVIVERISQANILTRMENQREELSGVSLDEELTKMIQYQRAFQGCSKLISIADTMYETLIGM